MFEILKTSNSPSFIVGTGRKII